MRPQPDYAFNRAAGPGLLLAVLLLIILGGCASGGAEQSARVDYGNPFYKHVRYLPENQAEAQAEQSKKTALPGEMSARELEQHGDSLMRRNRLAAAYAKYEQALAKAPDNLEIQIKMARALTRGGYHNDAVKLLIKVLDYKPDSAAAWEAMGIISFEKSDYPKALEHFAKTLALDANRWKAYTYQGQIHDIRKEHDLAARAYQKAIALQPGKGLLYNNMGVSYALAGQHLQAVTAFKRAIRLNYAPAKVFNNMGACLASLGRYAEAFEAFKKGVGEARAYNNLGCMYMLAGNNEAAIQSFEKAIAMRPHFYRVAYDNMKKAELAGVR